MRKIKMKILTTQQNFDLLVIERFKEMIEESSSPDMLDVFEKHIKQLKKNRKLTTKK